MNWIIIVALFVHTMTIISMFRIYLRFWNWKFTIQLLFVLWDNGLGFYLLLLFPFVRPMLCAMLCEMEDNTITTNHFKTQIESLWICSEISLESGWKFNVQCFRAKGNWNLSNCYCLFESRNISELFRHSDCGFCSKKKKI